MPVFNSKLWISFQLQNLIHPAHLLLSSPTSLTSCQHSPTIPFCYAQSWPVLPPCLHPTAPAHTPLILPCFTFTPALHPVPTYLHPDSIPFLHNTRNELGALGRLGSACAYTRTASSSWFSWQGQWNMQQVGTVRHWLPAHKSHRGTQNTLCHQTQNPH